MSVVMSSNVVPPAGAADEYGREALQVAVVHIGPALDECSHDLNGAGTSGLVEAGEVECSGPLLVGRVDIGA